MSAVCLCTGAFVSVPGLVPWMSESGASKPLENGSSCWTVKIKDHLGADSRYTREDAILEDTER